MYFTVAGAAQRGRLLPEPGGLVIDLTNMTAKRLDAKRQVCWAQTGNRWHDLYIYLQSTTPGSFPSARRLSTVGIPGSSWGGGLSFVSRSTASALTTSSQSTSSPRTASCVDLRRFQVEGKEQELWWRVAAGRRRHFGIAVGFELRVHKPPTPDHAGGPDPLSGRGGAGSPRLLQQMDRDRGPTNWRSTGFMGPVSLPAHPDIKVHSLV